MKLITSAVKIISRYNKRRETIAELNSMSSRQLADIGINRGDIKNIVNAGGAYVR